MNSEDDEFNRIEREAAMRMKAVSATVEKRGWVGLTDEEAMQICVDCGCLSEDWLVLLEAIEAKLKEKNSP
jgi:hypothetical protein